MQFGLIFAESSQDGIFNNAANIIKKKNKKL